MRRSQFSGAVGLMCTLPAVNSRLAVGAASLLNDIIARLDPFARRKRRPRTPAAGRLRHGGDGLDVLRNSFSLDIHLATKPGARMLCSS